ncbi:hypothetical protein SK128_011923 [Halocaridina rubra]|uniref:Uncharacterized protein n=1 Tax=Halocaridina rubra TaxID=373956 RepID=A0AAN8XS02_HALRR
MEIDQHLIWMLSAVKSVSAADIDENKLNHSISDCLNRIKGVYSSKQREEEFDDFRAKFTLVLVLSCPAIRKLPVVNNCRDFEAVIHAFPQLKESAFFSIVRTQKLYKFIFPVLSHLPPTTLQTLIEEFFACTSVITPVTLAVSLEMLKAFLVSLQTILLEDISMEQRSAVVNNILKFYSLKKVSNGSDAQVKLSAYYFMYLCECTYVLLCSTTGRPLEQPEDYGSIQVWKSLFETKDNDTLKTCGILKSDACTVFLQMCSENVQSVTVDMWMEWNDITLPVSVIVHKKSSTVHLKPQARSIQAVISNIAFDILKLIKSTADLKTTLEKESDLKVMLEFFQQVASDPDYDPDVNLPTDQLLKEINLKDSRYEKLMRVLLERNYIFTSQDCVDCISSHVAVVDNSSRLNLLKKMIKHVKEGSGYSSEAKEMVLNMADSLLADQLLRVLDECLDSGLDDCLKTQGFDKQMTSVFNQLAEKNSCKSSNKHIWLCLQSGQAVVHEAVRLPLAFPGLVTVMVQTLSSIPRVCQAKDRSGISVLATALQERLLAGLEGREQRDFVDLVKGLLESDVLDAQEVLNLFEPYLKVSNDAELKNLDLPLEILKVLIEYGEQALIKPGPELVGLILVLLYVIHSTCNLNAVNCAVHLKLRTDALKILKAIIQNMSSHPETFQRELSMLKQMIVKKSFHPRCIYPLFDVMDCKEACRSVEDYFLSVLFKFQYELGKDNQVKPLQIIEIGLLPSKLAKMSRQSWIVMLVQLLPHCSEEEWLASFYITHEYLKSGQMAVHTMRVFQEVLYWLCIETEKATQQEIADCEPISHTPSVSLQHCFRSFSNAAMMYIEDLMEGVPYDKRFRILCGISKWWCCIIPLYRNCQELPVLLLNLLWSAIEEMLNAGCLVLEDSGTVPQVNGESKVSKRKKKCKKKRGMAENNQESPSVVKVEESKCPVQIQNGDIVHDSTDAHDGKISISGTHDGNVEKVPSELSTVSSTRTSSPENITTDKRNNISSVDFKAKIEEISLCFIKYVPSSNLACSVAGKLKKLNDVALMPE